MNVLTNTDNHMSDITQILSTINLPSLAYAVILFILGYVIARLAVIAFSRALSNHINRHQQMLMRRCIFWFIFILFIITGLQQLGFKLGILLGAAGIFSVAIGFASQTSMSNLISGIFLIIERSFKLGDWIRVSNDTGEVIAIDLLSVKIKTEDNMLVRIPNSTLIKSNIINITHFPTRRLDLTFAVANQDSIEQVENLLLNIAKNNKFGLADPAPIFSIRSLSSSTVNIRFSVWTMQENYDSLQNSLLTTIQLTFAEINIIIS